MPNRDLRRQGIMLARWHKMAMVQFQKVNMHRKEVWVSTLKNLGCSVFHFEGWDVGSFQIFGLTSMSDCNGSYSRPWCSEPAYILVHVHSYIYICYILVSMLYNCKYLFIQYTCIVYTYIFTCICIYLYMRCTFQYTQYIYISKISMISVEESHQHFSNLELGETLII